MLVKCRTCKREFDFVPFTYSKSPTDPKKYSPECARCRVERAYKKSPWNHKVQETVIEKRRKRHEKSRTR